MGPYCKFCNNRCFVPIPATTPAHVLAAYGTSTIAATCPAGKEYERNKIGFCADDFSATETAVLLGCKCGWVGMAHSSPIALRNWHDHCFEATGGSHERIHEMAVSMPANGNAIEALMETVTGLNALGRFRKHEHLPRETAGLSMVTNHRDFQVRART